VGLELAGLRTALWCLVCNNAHYRYNNQTRVASTPIHGQDKDSCRPLAPHSGVWSATTRTTGVTTRRESPLRQSMGRIKTAVGPSHRTLVSGLQQRALRV